MPNSHTLAIAAAFSFAAGVIVTLAMQNWGWVWETL